MWASKLSLVALLGTHSQTACTFLKVGAPDLMPSYLRLACLVRQELLSVISLHAACNVLCHIEASQTVESVQVCPAAYALHVKAYQRLKGEAGSSGIFGSITRLLMIWMQQQTAHASTDCSSSGHNIRLPV